MNSDKMNFKDRCSKWKKILQMMEQENNHLHLQLKEARSYHKPLLEHGLKHFENRLVNQEKIIGLLVSQLEDLCDTYEKEGALNLPAFTEKMESFKTDIDRCAQLFSRLTTQFKAYLEEYNK